MKPGISGYTVVRNAISLDYCVGLTIESLSRICDEVVVCDSDSTDGTTGLLEMIAARNTNVRIVNYPWPNPKGEIDWFVKWIQFARSHLNYSHQLMLDADEVLDYESAAKILVQGAPVDECFWFIRNNYWRDARHLVPEGRCCANRVVRYGPSNLYMPSDEMYGSEPNMLKGSEPEMRIRAVRDGRLIIHHYGFLRRREALFDKCKVVLGAFFNTWDSRLDEARANPDKHWTEFCPFDSPLQTYNGTHPEIALEWLKERGSIL